MGLKDTKEKEDLLTERSGIGRVYERKYGNVSYCSFNLRSASPTCLAAHPSYENCVLRIRLDA